MSRLSHAVVVASLIVSATELRAQRAPGWILGAGVSTGGALAGTGLHAEGGRITRRIRFGRYAAPLRIDAFYHAGASTESPFACERVRPLYCLGRENSSRVFGATVGPVFTTGEGRSLPAMYVLPVAVGAYRGRTKIEETRGPAAICISAGESVPCADNPPWGTVSSMRSRAAVGFGTGLGISIGRGASGGFVELRAHRWGRRDVIALVTAGVRL